MACTAAPDTEQAVPGPGPPAETPALEPVSDLPVATSEATLADQSRPAEAPDEVLPSRTIDLKAFYPDAPGTFPLVLFAHGLGGDLDKQDALLEVVASHGYVVVAVRFPLTTGDRPGGQVVGDFVNQPADVRFVVDQLLTDPPADLRDRIDTERVALIGHSLGGATVLAAAAHPCCRDERADAVVAIAAADLPFPGGEHFGEASQPPLLMIQGDADTTVAGELRATKRYPQAVAPKFLLTVLGGNHVSPVEGPPTAEIELVSTAIAYFLDRYVKGAEAAVDQLRQLVAGQPELATLESAA